MTVKQMVRRHTERRLPLWFTDPADGKIRFGIPHNFYADPMFEDMEFESRIPDEFFYVELMGVSSDPDSIAGVCTRKASEVFSTQELARRYQETTKQALVQEYKKELPDAEAIIRFCLAHVVAPAEQYTDDIARQAVLERGKELFGDHFPEEKNKNGK